MAINFSQQVLAPAFNVFARPMTFTPTASQPGQPTFTGRGCYGTQPVDVMGEDSSIFSDARTVVDIIEEEFTVIPAQNDTLYIPAHIGMPALGTFQVMDVNTNGGGETTLFVRKIMVAKP